MRAPQLAARHVVAKIDRRRQPLRVGPAVALDAKKGPSLNLRGSIFVPQKAGAPARVIIERINDCRTIGSPAQVNPPSRSRPPPSVAGIDQQEGYRGVSCGSHRRSTMDDDRKAREWPPSAETVSFISEDRECRPVYALRRRRSRLIVRLRAPLAAAIHQPLEQSGVQAAAQKDLVQVASRDARQNTSHPRHSACPKSATPLAQMHRP
jgi:hypothetical protein